MPACDMAEGGWSQKQTNLDWELPREREIVCVQ